MNENEPYDGECNAETTTAIERMLGILLLPCIQPTPGTEQCHEQQTPVRKGIEDTHRCFDLFLLFVFCILSLILFQQQSLRIRCSINSRTRKIGIWIPRKLSVRRFPLCCLLFEMRWDDALLLNLDSSLYSSRYYRTWMNVDCWLVVSWLPQWRSSGWVQRVWGMTSMWWGNVRCLWFSKREITISIIELSPSTLWIKPLSLRYLQWKMSSEGLASEMCSSIKGVENATNALAIKIVTSLTKALTAGCALDFLVSKRQRGFDQMIGWGKREEKGCL